MLSVSGKESYIHVPSHDEFVNTGIAPMPVYEN